MSPSQMTFVGVDLSGGRNPFTYAAFDHDCQLITLAGGEVEDVFSFLDRQKPTRLAVNAPPRPNHGLVRKILEQQSQTPGHLRGTDMRLAEYELRERGISVSPTPSRPETCAAWMQLGFDFYRRLMELEYKPYPTNQAAHQWLETHPHAAYCVLLGQLPLPKPMLEGRLQRQLVLYSQGAGVKDPMDFFEEITRHKLMRGVLPMEFVYAAEELDALVAAYTAYLAGTEAETLTAIGDEREGIIYLPSAHLQESYT